jgi:protein TonB
MKKNVRSKIWALAITGSVLFFAACNNSDYTKSASDERNTSANDTTMNNSSADDTTMTTTPRDTSINKQSANSSEKKQSGGTTKKRKISIGTMPEKATSMKPDKSGIYNVTDVRPSYPDGQAALEDYINNQIDYQQPAIDDNTEGTANIQFVIDENGNVIDAKPVGKELGNGLDQEAVRVISRMPKWEPGKVKGKNVKTRVVLPITYKIEE